jgi:hypothetical protein
MNLGAFFAAPVWKRRKKPGYPLQFLSANTRRLRDFRSYPLRGFVFGADVPSRGNSTLLLVSGYWQPVALVDFFALDAAKSPIVGLRVLPVRQAFGLNGVCGVKNHRSVDFSGFTCEAQQTFGAGRNALTWGGVASPGPGALRGETPQRGVGRNKVRPRGETSPLQDIAELTLFYLRFVHSFRDL